MVCSWQLVASWVFVHGGQRHSSIGGQLRVAASPVMVMAIPYPFAFVPFASSLFFECFGKPQIIRLVATRMKTLVLWYCGNHANFRVSRAWNQCFFPQLALEHSFCDP
ncbi:uncharacterized protein LOC17884889 [Capsella rubella]|uniref:uncharacterized protein LOC17884889 n=1 Tax=Capsella rubella TaxID=81985 RepID=UPI000CD5B587|nr:uncharacterized protein LOC17884889 [Capsella rubella]